MKIGEIDIGNIKLDKSSRDDVPRLLMGLQSVYLNKALLKKISDIMMEEMLPKVKKKTADMEWIFGKYWFCM